MKKNMAHNLHQSNLSTRCSQIKIKVKRELLLRSIESVKPMLKELSFQGIPHYDGLYDQSKYFDAALSRYYDRKGWGLIQFSILRSLSELLIEKILVDRYSELHHQR